MSVPQAPPCPVTPFSGTDQAPEFPSWRRPGTVHRAGLYLVSAPF